MDLEEQMEDTQLIHLHSLINPINSIYKNATYVLPPPILTTTVLV